MLCPPKGPAPTITQIPSHTPNGLEYSHAFTTYAYGA